MYVRTPQQELTLDGRRLLSRHFYGGGRYGWPQRNSQQDRVWGVWRVVKHRPKAVTWAKASGSSRARKVHAIRYSLCATHTKGTQVYLTVWQCGGHANSAPLAESNPVVVCAGCVARLSGMHEVELGTVDL